MSRTALSYGIVVVALAAALGLALALAPAPVSSLPSVHNPGPRGLMALRLLLEQVPELELRVHALPGQTVAGFETDVLVIAEPAARVYSAVEAAQLLDRVETGTRLVLLLSGSEGEQAVGLRHFLRQLDIRSRDLLPCEASPTQRHVVMEGVERSADGIGHLLVDASERAVSLLSCAEGSALLALQRGCGEVLVLSQLELLDNRHLGQPQRARLALNLRAPAGARRVLIDESHHTRIQTRVGLSSLLRRGPFLGAFAVLLLASLLFVWARAPRRGGVRPRPELIGVEVEPSVRGLALLYRDSRDPGALWQRVLACAREAGVTPEDPTEPADLDEFARRAAVLLAAVDERRGIRPGAGQGSGPGRAR